jgi:hypothetical protein
MLGWRAVVEEPNLIYLSALPIRGVKIPDLVISIADLFIPIFEPSVKLLNP